MSEYIYEHKPSGADHMGKPVELQTLVQREEIVRCRDCKYYDGEPDMESMGEKCWRDPSHSGRSMPTVADGYCWRGKRKEGGDE